MATVAELVGAVGPRMLDVAHGRADVPVRDVCLVTGADDHAPAPQAGDLVVYAGRPADDLAGQVSWWGRADVAAVAVSAPAADDPRLRQGAEEAGVCLIAVAEGTAWAQLVWLLVGLLDAAPAGAGQGAGPGARPSGFGELFTLADALEAVLGGPVTIEDAASRVLAHSAGQEGADPARLSTIVGRRVPPEVTERFRSMGVLRALQRSDEPVVVPSWAPGIKPRLAIPVRAGRELLGSIWAAVDHPVPPEHASELQRVVSMLALQLLRLRAQEDLVTRLESDRLRAALDGVPPTGWTAPGTASWRAVCLAPGSADRWRSVLRWAGWRTPLVTEVAGSVVALVDGGHAASPGSWAWLRANAPSGLLAASDALEDLQMLPAARVEAAEVMQLLRSGATGTRSAADSNAGGNAKAVAAEDVWAARVIARAVAATATVPPSGPVSTLLEHDRAHGTTYAATLEAHLAHPGDPRAAAARLHVHPNTFRYRLRRMAELAPLDLDDEQVRLAVRLQLLGARSSGARS